MNADSADGRGLEQVYDVYPEAGLGGFATSGGERAAEAQYELNYARLLPARRDASFLDIGCGAGTYLLWLRGKGYTRLHGVDLSNLAVEHCRMLGLEQIDQVTNLTGYLAAHPRAFDVISLNDVIEHFSHEEMLPTLYAMREALRPGGVLLVKTLNMGNVGGIYLRYNDFTHRVGFTETSLRQVLIAAGFARAEVTAYRVPTQSLRSLTWRALGGAWRRLFGMLLLLDVGVDRPKILAKTLLAVARTSEYGRSG